MGIVMMKPSTLCAQTHYDDTLFINKKGVVFDDAQRGYWEYNIGKDVVVETST